MEQIASADLGGKMKSEFEWNRMMAQQLYSPYKVGDDSWERVHQVLFRTLNDASFFTLKSAVSA